MSEQAVNRISARVVLGLSLFAMLLVCSAAILTLLGRFDPAPGGDEGTPAHLFQLAIVLLLPAVGTFLVTADWQEPTSVAKRMALPAAVVAVAFATLYYLEHVI